MTTWPADRLEAILLLATFPMYFSPIGFTDAQTKRSPLTYPPCPFSHLFRVPGLQSWPTPDKAIATELMRHPALQIVFEEVPSCSLPHLESHCLQSGQLLVMARATRNEKMIIFAAILQIFNQYLQYQQNINKYQGQKGYKTKLWPQFIQKWWKGLQICGPAGYNNIRMSKSKSKKKINNYVIFLEEPLGSGAYATVYKARDEQSNTPYAVKVIQRAKMEANPYTAKAIKLQISIHQSLIHPNIVRVADIIQTPNNYYIFQEYCSGGNLRNLLIEQPSHKLSQSDALHCIKCICAAFKPMFEKGVIHRDLKPENIVIEGEQLKLTDFGFAKAMASSRQLTHTTIGTPLYMSPQLLSKQPYTSKCDVWSIGILFYEMIFGHHPWAGNGIISLYNNIMKEKEVYFPPEVEISEVTRSLIIQCLQVDEDDRLSWMELYQHKIWDASFHEIAQNWRGGYQLAQQKINQLREDTQIQVLVGVFLRVRTPALNFLQFYAIMQSLFGDTLQQKEAGMMYQLFDKDSNGVIDLQQFVGYLSDCSPQVLKLLNRLVSQNHYYQDLSDKQKFAELTEMDEEEVRVQAYQIIANMNY